MKFNFNKADRKVEAPDGAVWNWAAPTEEEVGAFAAQLEMATLVFRILSAARSAFEGGIADYEDATSRLRTLLSEGALAAREIVEVCDGIRKWVGLPEDAFVGRGDEFVKFCRDWIAAAREG